jgi:signal transduction histidine kinase
MTQGAQSSGTPGDRERELSAACDHVPLLVCSGGGQVVHATSAATRALGVAGISLEGSLPAAFWTSLSSLGHAESRLWTSRDGRSLALTAFKAPPLVIGVVRDAGAEAEPERHLQRQRLEVVGRLAGSFVQDLRGALTSIVYNTELVGAPHRAGNLPAAEVLRDIRSATGRLQQTLDRMLEFSELGADRRGVAVADVFNQAAGLIQPLLRAGGHQLEQYVGPDAAHLSTNRVLLLQALVNLLINAVEAGRGNRHVRLSSEHVPSLADKPSSIDFVVQDDGPGVPELLRQHIFEPFFSTKPQAVGVGLWAARRSCSGCPSRGAEGR